MIRTGISDNALNGSFSLRAFSESVNVSPVADTGDFPLTTTSLRTIERSSRTTFIKVSVLIVTSFSHVLQL